MDALQLTRWGQEPAWRTVPRPRQGPRGVLLRVAGSGLCGSDLHFMEPGAWRPWQIPFTLGHEVTGWVEEVGTEVRGWETGTPVAVYGAWGCGTCGPCSGTREILCRRRGEFDRLGLGLGHDGGMASHVVVPDVRHLVRLPPNLDPIRAAPLGDAGLTALHAVSQARHLLVRGSRAVIIGCGGIGLMVIQLVRALSEAEVTAADVDEVKLEGALAAGAHRSVHSEVSAAPAIVGIGTGIDVVFDCVGTMQTLTLARDVVQEGGHVSIIGEAGGSIAVGFGSYPVEVSVVIPHWGSRDELAEVIQLAAQGSISTNVELIPLRDALEGYRRLRDGDSRGRLVAVPDVSSGDPD